MRAQVAEFRKFISAENATWKALFDRQAPLRDIQLHPIFSEGLKLLEITAEQIPDLESVNRRLKALTGFIGVPVEGLERPSNFFEMLAAKEFPIGNFIRNMNDLSYTPAPDIFHDLYGHLPFLANQDYAEFSVELGARACAFSDSEDLLKQWDRLYWFGVEFPIIETPEGNRIFGAGIASSFGECAYALSDKPKVLDFDIERIRQHDFKIDEFQHSIYRLKSTEQLYSCLDEFQKGCT